MPLPPIMRPTTPPPRVRFPIAEAFGDNRTVVRGRRLRPSELRPSELYPPRTPSPTYSLYPPSNASSDLLFRLSPHKSSYRNVSPAAYRLSELKMEDSSLELLRPFGQDTQGPTTSISKSTEAVWRSEEANPVGKEVRVGGTSMGRIVSDSAIVSRTSEWAAEQARLTLKIPKTAPIDIQPRRASMPPRIVGFGGMSPSPPPSITHRPPQTMGRMFQSRANSIELEESLMSPPLGAPVELKIRPVSSALLGPSFESEVRHPARHVERFLERERMPRYSWSYDGSHFDAGDSSPESEGVVRSAYDQYGSQIDMASKTDNDDH